MSSTLVEIQIPDAATEAIEAAGLSVSDFMQRLLHKIASSRAVPLDLLDPVAPPQNGHWPEEDSEEQKMARGKAIDKILQRRPKIIGPPITIEEIISARDEGRK